MRAVRAKRAECVLSPAAAFSVRVATGAGYHGTVQARSPAMSSRNPQAEQMGDESMARNLAHQAEAIWPQESVLFDRYQLAGGFDILDVGCGTGEITRRLAQRYPQARLLGLDILEGNLQLARRDSAAFGERIRYEV